MTTALVAARPSALALGRAAAGLAVASAAIHLLLLDAGSLGSVAMMLMAAACLPCAWHLWRSPTGAVWRMTAMVDAAMLALHAQLLSGSDHTMAGMDHSSSPTGLMWTGLGLITGQLALAGLSVTRR